MTNLLVVIVLELGAIIYMLGILYTQIGSMREVLVEIKQALNEVEKNVGQYGTICDKLRNIEKAVRSK